MNTPCELNYPSGEGEFLRGIQEHESKEKLVPSDHEGIQGHAGQGRGREGNNNPPDHAKTAAPIDQSRVLHLKGEGLKVASEHIQGYGKGLGEVHEYEQIDRIPKPHPGEHHVQGDHQDDCRKHIDEQDAEGHKFPAAKTEPGHGVSPYRGQGHREYHGDNGDIHAVGDVSEKAVFKEDLIIGVKIDFSNIQPQVAGLEEDLPQRLERRDNHPIKGEGHDNDEEDETHNPENPDNCPLQMLSAHLFVPPFMEYSCRLPIRDGVIPCAIKG